MQGTLTSSPTKGATMSKNVIVRTVIDGAESFFIWVPSEELNQRFATMTDDEVLGYLKANLKFECIEVVHESSN